jgi:alkyl hydroperoxide reductase subunit AhpF
MTQTPYKQIIIAAADGAKAALAANEYLTTFNGGNHHGKTA